MTECANSSPDPRDIVMVNGIAISVTPLMMIASKRSDAPDSGHET